MAIKRISVANLEFDSIKDSLKEFLRGQPQFTDFDFEGSNMSILLDVLAYNTHYNALYTNMALNEVFLDSASKRSSVVSLAKSLGYTPRGYAGGKTLVDFVITNTVYDTSIGPDAYLTLPKYSEFQGVKDGVRYSFYTLEDITSPVSTNGTYAFQDVEIIEGVPTSNAFEYTEQNAFIIPNTNIDISTLVVRVQPNPSNSYFDTYNYANTHANLDGESKVFFIKELDGNTVLYFGDNIIGKRPDVGSIINTNYILCSGADSNGIRVITFAGAVPNSGEISNLTIQTPINGGRSPENIEEIRFNAPNVYAAQNRAVTSTDYESLLLSKVPAIEDVTVWGGENNEPPIYGKVFISAKTTSNRTLSILEQETIKKDVLDKYKMVTIIPEFVNPAFINVGIDAAVYYDESVTRSSAETLKTALINSLVNFNTIELRKFNRILRQSQLHRLFESVDPSIISSVVRMKMHRSFDVELKRLSNYTVKIINPFMPGTISSSAFYVNANDTDPYYFMDDGLGVLYIHKIVNGISQTRTPIGTVNYDGGILQITNLHVARLATSELTLSISPAAADIASLYNQIVQIDTSKVKVSVISDKTTQGRAMTGNAFVFTGKNI